MKKFKKPFQKPLHVTISVLFILLILVVGFILSFYNYRETSTIVISATNKLFNELALEVALNFQGTYSPVIQNVSLLSNTHAIQGDTLDERLSSISLLADVLKHEETISGLQIGYESGDYFILRPLPSKYEMELFKAPEGASYVVDDIAMQQNGSGILRRVFLNNKFREIERLAPTPSNYDPRKRPWYIQAMETSAVVLTPPYLFHFLGKVGVTASRQVPGGSSVVAADITLEQIADTLAHASFAPHEEKVLLRRDGKVLAYNGRNRSAVYDRSDVTMSTLSGLGSDVLRYVAENIDLQPGDLRFTFQGRDWLGMVVDLEIGRKMVPRLLLLVPADELLVNARRIRQYAFYLTLLTIVITIPVTWFISHRISSSMRRLALEAQRVSRFDFDSPLTIKSRITEVNELAGSMRILQKTIGHFLQLIRSVAGEQDFDATLKRITRETMTVSRADVVVSYLVDNDQSLLVPDIILDSKQGVCDPSSLPAVPLSEFPVDPDNGGEQSVLTVNKEHRQAVFSDFMEVDELTLVPIVLADRQGNTIGMLALLYRDTELTDELSDRLSFVRAFSGFAAVSLETRQLIKMQKQLLDSFIGLLAGAIDEKSAYTGGHCQRVPVITEMLARAACKSGEPHFKDFDLSDEEWEELHLAAWLHDCGKVTTPEYVVDKATKLETIYNRIHEVRTRFEVLKRDAEIAYWQQVADGGDRDMLGKKLRETCTRLDDDFAFVAACNLGGEFMAPESMERLQKIASKTWMRTLDDQLGLSWQEMERRGQVVQELPVQEYLLADKAEHCISRSDRDRVETDNPWGFKLEVPKYLYNLGELHNLQVERGTLTAEERFKINDHIVQTIKMLSQLPLPRHLSRVTEIAGSHHETMIGTGYPRKLSGDQMSLTARMMAIADIFEALTASDRPYKKAKKLSEALEILFLMKKEHHIDPQLFELFLTSGVYLEYAEKYLDPQQIDEVNIKDYLG
jgi:HD-GYP domain-containing protein (c-di-GMP phosphodiesterase class II)/HAMP domain-containing protein